MTIRLLVLSAMMVLMIGAPAGAQTMIAPLTVDLSSKSINITSGFSGAELSVFGVKGMPGEVAIVVQGPERRTVVRRKSQIAGIWMNTRSMSFRNVPVYYDLALSRAEKDIAGAQVMGNLGIGLDALDFDPVGNPEEEEFLSFKEALVRNKQTHGHFPLEPRNVIFMSDNFFRANFYMPADIPTGDYLVKTYLFREGELSATQETRLKIGQVGTSAQIYRFAYLHSLAYGLGAVLMAVLAGAGAWFFLRRE